MRVCRKKYLLEQAYLLLKQQHDSGVVLNLLEAKLFYDKADCDGHCLLNDIADELGLDGFS